MTFGQWGEALVAEEYEKRGFVVIARNWRSRYGELDLVVQSETDLVFVEVKTRKTKKFGEPFEAVNGRKQEKLRITAELFMIEYPDLPAPRFDVVSVFAPQGMDTKSPNISYLEAAF